MVEFSIFFRNLCKKVQMLSWGPSLLKFSWCPLCQKFFLRKFVWYPPCRKFLDTRLVTPKAFLATGAQILVRKVNSNSTESLM